MVLPLQDNTHGKAAKRACSFSLEENGCDISIYPLSSGAYYSSTVFDREQICALLKMLAEKENAEMYENIDTVLDEVKDWFGNNYGESFQFKRDPRDEFALYQSENYEFEVSAAFIQARTEDDFQVPIKDRLEDVLKEASIEKGKRYRLSSKVVDKPMPIEYCIEPSS